MTKEYATVTARMILAKFEQYLRRIALVREKCLTGK